MLDGLDLFSGIGGNTLALREWVNTVAYCERDRFAQAVLLSRMRDGTIPNRPIWDDITTLRGEHLPPIDIIVGGFPCQDISVAGNGAGLEGKRSGLFFEIVRLVDEVRPKFIFLENVPAITVRGLDKVTMELTKLRYDCRWATVSAKEVGAPHLRKRWFLLANSSGVGLRLPISGQRNEKIYAPTTLEDGKASNSDSERLEGQWQRKISNEPKEPFATSLLEGNNWDAYAEFLRRVDHGLPNRSHRLRCLGNSVVPQSARKAFGKLLGAFA